MDLSGEYYKMKKKSKAGTIVLTIFAVLFAAALGVYIYFGAYYKSHFYRGTTLNGMDVSNLEAADVQKKLADSVKPYQLTLKELDGKSEVIKAADAGVVYTGDISKVRELKAAQNGRWWLLGIFEPNDLKMDVETSYDLPKAEAAIRALACLDPANVTLPKDASIKETETYYEIEPEVEGNQVNRRELYDLVETALSEASDQPGEVDLVAEDCYLHPKVRSTDERLNRKMEQLNSYLDVDVDYVFGDDVEKINAAVVKTFLKEDAGGDIYLDEDSVKELVGTWADKYNTYRKPLEFTTHSGREITVPGGNYGRLMNQDETVSDILEAIEEGESGEREASWKYDAMGWSNGGITGTYVEVSIDDQHLWCYKDGDLVIDTDVVTGKLTADRKTERGVFRITYKKSPAVLGSYEKQGYESPVKYWCPFNGGQGLHDANWRGSFGGTIYKNSGSHGCVNIPPRNMPAIYETVSKGTAVVVY